MNGGGLAGGERVSLVVVDALKRRGVPAVGKRVGIGRLDLERPRSGRRSRQPRRSEFQKGDMEDIEASFPEGLCETVVEGLLSQSRRGQNPVYRHEENEERRPHSTGE